MLKQAASRLTEPKLGFCSTSYCRVEVTSKFEFTLHCSQREEVKGHARCLCERLVISGSSEATIGIWSVLIARWFRAPSQLLEQARTEFEVAGRLILSFAGEQCS
jgi:hypothetical protein